MSQFSFFPQPDGTDPLADSLTQYRRSKKALGQRSPEDKRFMDLGRAFADMIGSVEPTNLLSIGGIAEEFGDVTKFIDRAKTINTRSDLEEELSSGILSPQEAELKQQQIDFLDKLVQRESEQQDVARDAEIAETGVVGMFGEGVKAGVTQGVISTLRGINNLTPFDGDAFWSGAQRESGKAIPEGSIAGNIGQAVGSGAYSAAAFAASPYVGIAAMGLQGYGGGIDEYEQAFAAGLTTGDYNQFQKVTAGLTSAAIEGVTEWIGAGVAKKLAKTGVAQWFAQPGARGIVKTVGGMYGANFLEEGLVPILQAGVKATELTGMKVESWGDVFSQAATDALYGGFGGFGAGAINIPVELSKRRETNRLLREAGSKYADPAYIREILPQRAAALDAMTPQERLAEEQRSQQALMQAGADLARSKEAVANASAEVTQKRKELERSRRGKDQQRTQALEGEVSTLEAALENARRVAATTAADYSASQLNYLSAASIASSARPTSQMSATDILAGMNYQPASAATKQQKAAQAQIEKLGFKVQWYDGTDAKPAFFSGQTPDTVFLRADGNSTFAGIMGLAFHEITHWAQFSDSGLWAALRSTVDDATMIEAATNYWSQQAGIDPVVRRSIAEIIAQSQGKAGSTEAVDQIEQRMAGTMAEVEGVAQLIQNGTEALFRGDAVPGWFNQMLIRAGVRGRSAMSALKLYRGLQEAAKNNKAYSPGKFGFTIEAAQRGLEVMRAAREAAMSQPQPAQPAPASTATPTPQPAPAPAAATPAAPAPAPAAGQPAPAPAPAPAPSPAPATAAAPAPAPAEAPALAPAQPAGPTARDIIGPVTPESEAAMTRAVSTLGPQGYRDAVAAIDLALAEVKREDEAAGRPYSFDGVSREEVLSLLNQTALADEGATLPDGKPVTVTSDQRELAKKVRRKVRRTVGDDVVLFARGKAVPATIDAAAFIESALELANSQKWKNQKLFKAALQKMVKAVASKEGIDLTKDSERVNDYVSRMVVREVRRALSQSANAVGWYDEKVRKALAVVSLIHPELADDKMAQFAFKWALAVTSNGAKVTDNFKAAERAYRFYKENGRLPIDQGTGTPSEAINEAMELFNDLVAKYGIEDVERFMSTKHTVREIRKYTGVKPGGEYVDTILYGASVVGPKIGNGFFANLYGNFEQLTMDRWFMRTIGRLTGTLIIPKPEVVAKRRTQLRRILAVMSDEQRSELFSTIGVKAPKLKLADAVEGQPAEFAMSNDMTDKIAEAIKKHVTDKATRNVFNTLFPIGDASALLPILGKAKEGTVREAYGNEIRKIANGLWTAKDGQKEIPDGPAERNRLRAIFADALDELRQDYPDLTMADLQAVIWYPEKRLYDASKTKEKSEGLEYEDGAPDYETAAIELAKGLGVSDTAISAATKGIDDDISAKRAAGAGRVSGGTDAGAAVQVQSARDVGERIAGDRGGVRAIGATTPLEGAPVVAGATGPDPRIVAVAERYAQANGINLRRQAYYATVDEDRAQRIAAAYDAMPHAPTDPAVVEAYQNLINQTIAQYRALEEAGYQFYFYDETTDPYDGKPYRAMRDLRNNKRMGVFSTDAGFGTGDQNLSDNLMLADTGLQWPFGSMNGPTRRVLANDLFRAVHDAFGHSIEGAGFRSDGEENAWQAHVRLFTGSAVAAITSETRGQNSWLNFGPYGERNRTAAVQDTVFAPQKSGLMPAFTWEEGRVPDMPDPTGPGGGITPPQPSVVSARQPAAVASDADYLAAVERGDMATAQRMVDEAARVAGYETKAFHGSPERDITEFTTQRTAIGFYFSPDENTAEFYTGRDGGRVYPVFLNMGKTIDLTDESEASLAISEVFSKGNKERDRDDVRKFVARLYREGYGKNDVVTKFFDSQDGIADVLSGGYSVEELLSDNMIDQTEVDPLVESIGLDRVRQQYEEQAPGTDADVDEVMRAYGTQDFYMNYQDDLMSWARANYDSVVFDDPSTTGEALSYVVFDNRRIKLADPVTRDEQGNVIPLSKRFDPSESSILYARDPGQRRIDLAYGMGRRAGQQAGVARGRQELLPGLMSAEEQVERLRRAREEVRARRKEDRLRERAKRAALAGRMQARIGRIMAAVEAMRQSADEDSDQLMRRALREMLRREAAGSRTGYEFARRELTALKREAADAVRLLPANMRGKYLNRIASVRSAVGVLRISDAVVRDLARYEARSSFNRLRRLERRYSSPQTGMTNELRDQILPIVRAGMALLGGQRLMQYTDVNDMSQRIAAANQLAAQARGMYEQERENWRADREMRREGYADAAEALAGNISQMPELPPSRLWSEGRTAGMVGALAIKNSDIHTIAALIDGAIDGPIHDMIHRLSAGKDAMYNDRRRIDQQIDGLLRQAGFTGIDDYVQRGAGYGGTAAADVIDVVLGGTARRITIGEAMSLAAMDDTTLALLADENDPEQPGSPITFSRDGGKLPIPVTRQEVLALRGRLSPGQLALIDGLKGLIDTEIRERSFEVAYRINGRMPEAVPGYYPRRRLSDAIAGDTVDVNSNPGNVVMTMLDNAGFLQRRVASTSPLVVDDLVRTIDGHVDEGLRLIHMSEPLRHSITVLRSAGVKDAMESRFGGKFNDQMRKVVFNAVGLSGRPTGDLIDRINGNISGALLMLNPKTWFRQLGGIFRLASEFDTGDWAAGSRRSIALSPSQRTAMIDRIEETSGYFFDRHRRSQVGLFAGVIGDPRQNRERIASMLRSLASNLRSAVDEATQGNIQRMLADLSAGRTNALTILRSVDFALRGIDRQVMLAAYMTARQSLSRTDPSMAEDEAHASACVMAEQAFRRTQNVSDPLDDTVFAAEQKFSKGYGRLLFPFSSDPLKGWNQARRATLNPQNAGRTAFAIGANMIWSAAANPLSLGLAAIGTGLVASEDEDDELLKRALMEKQREGVMRRIANELVASAGGYAGIIAGDIYTAYRAMSDGYAPDQTIQLMPLQVANEVIRSASMGDYGAMAGDLAMMAGIPVTMPIESISRDVEKTIATPDSIRKILLARKQSVGLTPAEEQRLREVQAEIRALKALQTQ